MITDTTRRLFADRNFRLDTAPYFLLGPWGSVLADRRDRHRMLVVGYTCALRQSLAALLVFLVRMRGR